MSDSERCSFTSGMIAFREKRYDEAITLFTQAIREKSDIHKAFNALGVSYFRVGNEIEAEANFAKALLLDPHNSVYERNMSKIQSRISSQHYRSPIVQSPGTGTRRFLFMIGIVLIALTALFFLLMFSLFHLQTGVWLSDGPVDGTGLLQPFIGSLLQEEYVVPVASVSVENKKIDYFFDRHQDLSLIKRVEAVVSIPSGREEYFPEVTIPQNNLYYGIDDPFSGKEKRLIVTGYFQDESPVVLADELLPPR